MNARSFANQAWSIDQYELIDFGEGRKLERFHDLLVDRPCPAANGTARKIALAWRSEYIVRVDQDNARQAADRQQEVVNDWRVQFETVQFQLRMTPFGHVGLFPEHAAQWLWLLDSVKPLAEEPLSILNLFAYTGGASLVLASHGWQVTHVDASEPTVQWARHNAQLSDLSTAPIRWLVEDARTYVARELKRGRRYHAILLDPPSYGHGPKGKAWQIERDLPTLLEQCCQLLLPQGALVLTGHSESTPLTADDLTAMRRQCGHGHITTQSARVSMRDFSERALDFGWSLRSHLID